MATLFGTQQAISDRRSENRSEDYSGPNRRQFGDSRDNTRPEVAQLADAVDQYKLRNRRRFITYEELYDVMYELGYRQSQSTEL